MVMVYLLLIVIGFALGSFTNALAWRVYKQSTFRSTKKRAEFSISKGRSMCPECRHVLAAKDLIPILSWLSLGGKCRYCHKSISIRYPSIEGLYTIALVVSFYFWPLSLVGGTDYLLFGMWSVLLVLGFAMSSIDAQYQLLPSRLVYLFGAVAALFTVINAHITNNIFVAVSAVLGALVSFSIFWLIYQVSGGSWIGGGDVRLVAVMGLLLGWQKVLLAIILSAYVASGLVLVLVILRKYHKRMKIAFGPFLLFGTYLAFLWGDSLIEAYKRFSGL